MFVRATRPETFKFPAKRLDEKKLVDVAFEVVALTAVKSCRVEEAVARRFERVERPEILSVVPKRFVEKRFVEVAAVVVERRMLLKTFEPVKALLSERSVEEAEPLPPQPIQLPTVRVPMVAVLARISVVEARPETKRLVVVAFVVVERSAMKPPVKVELAVEMNPLKNPNVVEVETPQLCTLQAKAPGPPPPVGQVVIQLSPERQMVSKVALTNSPSATSSSILLEIWETSLSL